MGGNTLGYGYGAGLVSLGYRGATRVVGVVNTRAGHSEEAERAFERALQAAESERQTQGVRQVSAHDVHVRRRFSEARVGHPDRAEHPPVARPLPRFSSHSSPVLTPPGRGHLVQTVAPSSTGASHHPWPSCAWGRDSVTAEAWGAAGGQAVQARGTPAGWPGSSTPGMIRGGVDSRMAQQTLPGASCRWVPEPAPESELGPGPGVESTPGSMASLSKGPGGQGPDGAPAVSGVVQPGVLRSVGALPSRQSPDTGLSAVGRVQTTRQATQATDAMADDGEPLALQVPPGWEDPQADLWAWQSAGDPGATGAAFPSPGGGASSDGALAAQDRPSDAPTGARGALPASPSVTQATWDKTLALPSDTRGGRWSVQLPQGGGFELSPVTDQATRGGSPSSAWQMDVGPTVQGADVQALQQQLQARGLNVTVRASSPSPDVQPEHGHVLT